MKIAFKMYIYLLFFSDCLGVLTSGVDEIIDPPTCLNINSEPGASNHSTVIWFLSNERWLWLSLPPNITLSYGENIPSKPIVITTIDLYYFC